MGFQGSIKWWVLRHRLHHRYVSTFLLHPLSDNLADSDRFTDSPDHDPYPASKGLWWSHCGWIFLKPKYTRMGLINRSDLDNDPGQLSVPHALLLSYRKLMTIVVRFQHRYYVPIALFSGLILPTLIGWTWGDMLGGLVWGGAVARLLIWHSTFCINSFAHWAGLRPYTEEVSARGNYVSFYLRVCRSLSLLSKLTCISC